MDDQNEKPVVPMFPSILVLIVFAIMGLTALFLYLFYPDLWHQMWQYKGVDSPFVNVP